MIIGVVGATGFIGRHLVAECLARGYGVRAFGRNPAALSRLAQLASVETVGPDRSWNEALAGLDALVLAVGSFRAADMGESHADLPLTLSRAARCEGITRLVMVSAIGAAPDAPTEFLRSKAAGERAILSAKMPGWTVLRPSLVYGPGGASYSMLAQLAALPVRPRLTSGPVRPIFVGDLARVIVALLDHGGPLPDVVDAVGPERMALDDYVDALGVWLDVRPKAEIRIPVKCFRAAAARFRLFPTSVSLLKMLETGADGDPRPLVELTGIRPAPLAEGLARNWPSTGERLAAMATPWITALTLTFALFWIASGVVALFNFEAGLALLASASVTGTPAIFFIVAGSLLDIGLGLATLPRRWRGRAFALQALTLLAYTAIATALAPSVWGDPLGPLLKNAPIFAATLLLLAISRIPRHG